MDSWLLVLAALVVENVSDHLTSLYSVVRGSKMESLGVTEGEFSKKVFKCMFYASTFFFLLF